MKKKILIAVTTFALLVTFSLNVFCNEENNTEGNNISNETTNETTNSMSLSEQATDVQNKLTESNNQLQYVQSEMSTALQKVQEYSDSITEYENQYDDLSNQVKDLEGKIAETDARLTEIEEEYNKKETLLKKRVVAMYEAGDTTYLDLLVNSDNLVEFLSSYYLVEEIVDWDSNLLNEISEKEKVIESEKQKQEEQKSELKLAKSKAGQTEILLKNSKTLQENYMLQLTEEERTLNEQIETYKQEQAKIESEIQAAINWSGNLAIQYTGGQMIWPVGVEGTYITSGYGNRLHPIQGIYKNHDGIDIGNAGYGAPVLAAADGIVTYAGVMSGYGNCVMINHGNGIVTLYGHGQEIKATLGSVVKQGDIIMTVGSTGNSTGPHLHFEVRLNGVAVDPLPYLTSESSDNTKTENIIDDMD